MTSKENQSYSSSNISMRILKTSLPMISLKKIMPKRKLSVSISKGSRMDLKKLRLTSESILKTTNKKLIHLLRSLKSSVLTLETTSRLKLPLMSTKMLKEWLKTLEPTRNLMSSRL
jgi:hypothetical protein